MVSPVRARPRPISALVGMMLTLQGCAHDDPPKTDAESGGSAGTAGAAASGGAAAGVATGGLPNMAGAQNGTAGTRAPASGGVTASGGASASGGRNGDAGGASGGIPGGAGAGGAPDSDSQCVEGVAGLRVLAAWDSLGYAPYSLLDCQLAYVTPEGELRLRNLQTGDERQLEDKALTPRRPSVSAELVAWEATIDGRTSVRMFRGDGATTISGDFDHAGEPRASAGALVFTAWAGISPNSDSDVLMYDSASDELSTALGGPGQQRFADVSADYVAASDFSEDPRGYFDELSSLADVIVYTRSSGVLTQRARPGKQAFPMLGEDGVLAYLEWGAVHPEPKFSAFSLRLGRVSSAPEQDLLVRAVRTDPSYVRPSLRGRVIDFIDSTDGPALLYRADVATPSELIATELDFTTPLGPVAAPEVTLLAARLDSSVELRVVTRAVGTPSP